MSKYKYFIFLLFLFLSCEEDLYYNEELVNNYSEFIDNMVLDCPTEKSNYYFEGIINGQQTCYYDGVEGRRLKFGVGTSFVTPDPEFITGEDISNIKRGARISFMPYPNDSKEEFLWITFPFFNIKTDTIDYLDSLFAIEQHDIKSELDGDIFDRSFRKFEVEINMVDENGLGYAISTIYGQQNNSFMKINNVEKTIEQGIIYYYIEMIFECNLYHNPLFKKNGLWSKIEDGRIVAKFPI